MSRPEVSLANYEAVYDFYEQHEQSMAFARLGHFVMSKVYRPTITFEPGAEAAIQEGLEDGTRFTIAPNHLTGDDQNVILSVVEREKVFHDMRGHAFIPTEPSLFTAELKRGGQLLRRTVDGLGAIPIIRLDDLRRQGIEITPEIEEMHRLAMLRADEIEITKLIEQHNHEAVFYEGTRNRRNHTKLQPFKKGPAYTAIKAAQEVDLAFLPWAFYYGEPTDYKKHEVPYKYTPHVHIGMPVRVQKTDTPDNVIQLVRPSMQDCLDVAVSAIRDRAA